LHGKNEVADELAKLNSSQAMVPPGIFMQELHEPSITKALAKVYKVTESSQETTPPVESILESLDVMEIHSDWCTPFIIYLMIGAYQRTKTNMNDCIVGQGITL
jgi:hypothetical protein